MFPRLTLEQAFQLGKSYTTSLFSPQLLWVHLWVTERCQLDCSYCTVVDNTTTDPSLSELKSRISHAADLGAVVVAFMGGEPTIRKDLVQLIEYTHSLSMLSQVVTHGKTLKSKRLEDYCIAGLQLLELSVDGYSVNTSTFFSGKTDSPKNLLGDESLFDLLESAREKYSLFFKVHHVLAAENLSQVPLLLELSSRRNIPISFGYVHEEGVFFGQRRVSYADPAVQKELISALDTIIFAQQNGALVLNSRDYLLDGRNALLQGDFQKPFVHQQCDVGEYMVQVGVHGKIYRCSVQGKTYGANFLEIGKDYFSLDLHGSSAMKEGAYGCKVSCGSACGDITSRFRKNPFGIISRLF